MLFALLLSIICLVSAQDIRIVLAGADRVALPPNSAVEGIIVYSQPIEENQIVQLWLNEQLIMERDAMSVNPTDSKTLGFKITSNHIGQNQLVALSKVNDIQLTTSADFYIFASASGGRWPSHVAVADDDDIVIYNTIPGNTGAVFRQKEHIIAQFVVENFYHPEVENISISAHVESWSLTSNGQETPASSSTFSEVFPLNPIGVTCIELAMTTLNDGMHRASFHSNLFPSLAEAIHAQFYTVVQLNENSKQRYFDRNQPSVYAVDIPVMEEGIKILWPKDNMDIMHHSHISLPIVFRYNSMGHQQSFVLIIKMDDQVLDVPVDSSFVSVPLPSRGHHVIFAQLKSLTTGLVIGQSSNVSFHIVSALQVFGRSTTTSTASTPQSLSQLGPQCYLDSDSQVEFPELTLLIMTWKARSTLISTLQSYNEASILTAVNETIILFQEISILDYLDFGQYPRVRIIGEAKNLGIGRGQLSLLSIARTKYVLFLEHDWSLSVFNWRPTMRAAIDLIQNGKAKAVRLRDEAISPVAFNCHIPSPRSALKIPERLMNGLYCSCMQQKWYEDIPLLPLDQTGPIFWRKEEQQMWKEQGVHRCSGSRTDPPFICVPFQLCGFTNNPSLYERDWVINAMGAVLAADAGPALREIDPVGWKFYAEVQAGFVWPFLNATVAVPYRGIFAHTPVKD